MEVSSELHTSAALYPHGKKPWYSKQANQVGVRSGLGILEKRNVMLLQGIELQISQATAQSL